MFKHVVIVSSWLASITLLHFWLNRGAFDTPDDSRQQVAPMQVGFLPVTCHLTCPVTHFINENLNGTAFFLPKRFNAFPELKETFLSGRMEATFILAPLAMKMREQGAHIKIVYLGHRDGTTMMVHKDSAIRPMHFEDLRGKTVAIPNRYSNQHLIIFRPLKQRGINIKDVKLVEMPPPDMPAALSNHSVDAIIAGEPLMAKTEMDGYGRVMFMTKDVWPDFISCVLAVNEDVIRERRGDVQQLVDGIARSGKWIDESPDHRMQAAEFAAKKQYYNQDPELLKFVLSKPPDRIKYTNLSVRRADFEEIEELGREAGILEGKAHFDDYCDASFVPNDAAVPPYVFEARK